MLSVSKPASLVQQKKQQWARERGAYYVVVVRPRVLCAKCLSAPVADLGRHCRQWI